MKLCYCRFILALVALVLAIVWWPAAWARIVIILASAILAVLGIFYNFCCQSKSKEACCQPSEEPPKAE